MVGDPAPRLPSTPSERPGDELERTFGAPYRFAYHLGIFLAVNAIPDAYAVIDGPDCIFRKTEWVHGRHDLNSTLLDVMGRPRIVSTLMNAERVITDDGGAVAQRISHIARIPGAAVVLVCSMPHVMIVGTQYDRILRALQPRVTPRLLEVPSRSLDRDWLHGYSAVLDVLAADVDVSGGQLDPRAVALIGYFMDRTEEDHAANIREFHRLFAAIELDLASVWLGNQPHSDLSAVKNAATLISLPLGREAARILAKRTGARVIEVDTPFGAGRTCAMLRQVAGATSDVTLADAFMEREMRRIVPRLEWLVPHAFVGKRVAFSGAPELLGGFVQLARELGMRVVHLSTPSLAGHATGLDPGDLTLPAPMFAPTYPALAKAIGDLAREAPIDLVISNSQSRMDCGDDGVASMEFGFPSHYDHAIFDRPFLGFTGWLSFIDRMAQAIAHVDRRRANKAR